MQAMAHSYARQPSSKGAGRGPVDDGWQQPPHSQSHRGAPFPGGGGPGGGLPGMGTAGRLVEMLDAVRQEFEGISHDNSALKNQREEFEAKGEFSCLITVLNGIRVIQKRC